MIEILHRFTRAVLYSSASAAGIVDAVKEALASGANLSGAYLSRAYLSGADLSGKKITALKVFTGLYGHTVHAVLYQDGSCWVRMGCLFHSLEEWEKIGICNSNLTQFPNDGSLKCEERVAAFEFAKAAALRMVSEKGTP